MTAYYNENNKYAAEWLRNLINAGCIAPGVVDDRSIEDVLPSDLRGFTQCHFFAGVGVWSYALRQAGWADDRPVWTGSCPCQPFSAAGKGTGFADERHLWPAFHHLIKECKAPTVIGEQVASKDADPWIDLVQTDMEAMGYAFGSVPFPSAGVGAPHIRDRLYWVAYAAIERFQRREQSGKRVNAQRTSIERDSQAGGLADAYQCTSRQRSSDVRGGATGGDAKPRAGLVGGILPCRLANSNGDGFKQGGGIQPVRQEHDAEHGDGSIWMANPEINRCERSGELNQPAGRNGIAHSRADGGRPSPTNGFWRDADWLLCRDGKWRAVEPGTFPLVNGAPSRVGRLRAYGNAINAKAAQIFIESVMQ